METSITNIAPHWEHGYRCHGYWLNSQRLGAVSLPPSLHRKRGHPPLYSWRVDVPNQDSYTGETTNLATAKRRVEKHVKTHLAEGSSNHAKV